MINQKNGKKILYCCHGFGFQFQLCAHSPTHNQNSKEKKMMRNECPTLLYLTKFFWSLSNRALLSNNDIPRIRQGLGTGIYTIYWGGGEMWWKGWEGRKRDASREKEESRRAVCTHSWCPSEYGVEKKEIRREPVFSSLTIHLQDDDSDIRPAQPMLPLEQRVDVDEWAWET